MSKNSNPLPIIAISSCLLGEKVRYDGADKKIDIIGTIPNDLIKFIPICPEVAIGMGIPRPPIQLIEIDSGIEAIQIGDSDKNFSDPLTRYGKKMANELNSICGYIFKARSPSCGIGTTPVIRQDHTEYNDNGLYAGQIIQSMPDLPVTDENGLATPEQTEVFLNKALDYGNQQGYLDTRSVAHAKLRLMHYMRDLAL